MNTKEKRSGIIRSDIITYKSFVSFECWVGYLTGKTENMYVKMIDQGRGDEVAWVVRNAIKDLTEIPQEFNELLENV